MKFQDKFYDIIDHNKCPSSEKSDEKHLLRKSNFHHSEPNYATYSRRFKQKALVGAIFEYWSSSTRWCGVVLRIRAPDAISFYPGVVAPQDWV